MVTPAFNAKSFLKTLTDKPGVYQMYDSDQVLLYVGKAKNLKKRVSSYFKTQSLGGKTEHLVKQIAAIEVIVTETEAEALLLECTLIKEKSPKYNILLRDDKSYPYLYLNTDHAYPRLSVYRGKRRKHGKYFGPYPTAQALKETLSYIQKIFKLRSCSESYFANRTRPCLEYQIKRCKAPCVGKVSDAEYQQDVQMTVDFLSGRSMLVIDQLIEQMNHASDEREFEKAAMLRDQIQRLRQLQATQTVSTAGGDADVVAVVFKQAKACVVRMVIRAGQLLSSPSIFPQSALNG